MLPGPARRRRRAKGRGNAPAPAPRPRWPRAPAARAWRASGRAPSSAPAAAPGRRCAPASAASSAARASAAARMPPVSAASSSGAWSASAAQAARTRPTSCSCSATSAARSRSLIPGAASFCAVRLSIAPRSRSRPRIGPSPRAVKAVRRRRSPRMPSSSFSSCSERVDAAERGVAGIGRRAQLRVQGVPVRLDRLRDQGEPLGQPRRPLLVQERAGDDDEQAQVAPLGAQRLGAFHDPRPVHRQRSCSRTGLLRSSRTTSEPARMSSSISWKRGSSRRLSPDGFSPSSGLSHGARSSTGNPPRRTNNGRVIAQISTFAQVSAGTGSPAGVR